MKLYLPKKYSDNSKVTRGDAFSLYKSFRFKKDLDLPDEKYFILPSDVKVQNLCARVLMEKHTFTSAGDGDKNAMFGRAKSSVYNRLTRQNVKYCIDESNSKIKNITMDRISDIRSLVNSYFGNLRRDLENAINEVDKL